MNEPKLIPLNIWAARRYGDGAPSIKTLRRWVRDAKIQPQPEKNGRSYFVSENATYVDWSVSGTSQAHNG